MRWEIVGGANLIEGTGILGPVLVVVFCGGCKRHACDGFFWQWRMLRQCLHNAGRSLCRGATNMVACPEMRYGHNSRASGKLRQKGARQAK